MSVSDASRAGRMASALDGFVRSSPDIVAAAVVSFDGLPIASVLPPDMPEDRLGAMSAALLALGEQALFSLGRGRLHQVFVEGEHGFVFLMRAGDQAALAAVATSEAKVGFMLYEMRRTAAAVGAALDASVPVDEAAGGWPSPPGHPPPPGPPPGSPPGQQPGQQPWRDPDQVNNAHDDVGVLLGELGGRDGRKR